MASPDSLGLICFGFDAGVVLGPGVRLETRVASGQWCKFALPIGLVLSYP
jgi:hypothetical protein